MQLHLAEYCPAPLASSSGFCSCPCCTALGNWVWHRVSFIWAAPAGGEERRAASGTALPEAMHGPGLGWAGLAGTSGRGSIPCRAPRAVTDWTSSATPPPASPSLPLLTPAGSLTEHLLLTPLLPSSRAGHAGSRSWPSCSWTLLPTQSPIENFGELLLVGRGGGADRAHNSSSKLYVALRPK